MQAGTGQRLVKTGGRLVKHARCFWLLLDKLVYTFSKPEG